MHLSVAEGVQGEQAHEGHGAAPALLAVTKSAGNVLCAGDQEHPAQPTRVGAASTSEACVILDLCKKQGSKGQEEHFGAQPSPKTASLSSTVFE